MNIEVSVDGSSVIESYLLLENVDLKTKSDICGANIYNWKTRTIQYVINGSADCVVRVKVLDTVRIRIKVVMKVEDFFNGATKA